jgi:MFS family permease
MPKWVLGSRDFSFLLLTRCLVAFGVQMQAVAIGWLVYQIKGDPLYLGLIGLTEAGPALGLALFSGWIVDRGRPTSIYRRALGCSVLSASILWMVSHGALAHTDTTRLIAIFSAAFLTGTARSFLGPSQFSILSRSVERGLLSRATAWSTSLFQVASLSGPALGGFLYAWGGGTYTFFLILVLLAAALLTSTQISPSPPGQKAEQKSVPIFESFFAGVRFVFTNQILLAAMSLDMFGVLFGGATALFPAFAKDVFQNGPSGLGILRAAMPAGSFLMGGILIRFPISRFSGQVLLYAFFGFGICMTCFGLSTSFELSLFVLFMAGMFDSVSMVTRQTLLQLSTPDTMRGRVAAVSAIFIGSSNEIGAFESGFAAKLLGLRPSVVFGGSMTLLVVAVTWFYAPKLRNVQLAKL